MLASGFLACWAFSDRIFTILQLPLAQFLPPKELCILHPAFFANMFKTPQLRGVRHTAPYFHDNSAKSLEEVMEQHLRGKPGAKRLEVTARGKLIRDY